MRAGDANNAATRCASMSLRDNGDTSRIDTAVSTSAIISPVYCLNARLPMFIALRHLSRHGRHIATAMLPSSCALCGSVSDRAICDGCHAHFLVHDATRCTRCANVLPYAMASTTSDQAALCGTCLATPPSFDTTIAATHYAAPIDQLVLALKFGGHLALAPLFARLLHDAIQRASAEVLTSQPSLLTIVPLGARRLTERGFNQAQEIARPLAKRLDMPLHPQLAIRLRETLAQSSLLPDERRKNIRHAFRVPDKYLPLIQDQHIGVVDDVMTTGETLNELAATFKRAGAARVTNFVFARAPL